MKEDVQMYMNLDGILYPLIRISKTKIKCFKRCYKEKGLPRYFYFKSLEDYGMWPSIGKNLDGTPFIIHDHINHTQYEDILIYEDSA